MPTDRGTQHAESIQRCPCCASEMRAKEDHEERNGLVICFNYYECPDCEEIVNVE